MASHTNNQLVPQTDEDIIDIKWVAKTDLSIYLNDSYDTIVKIVTKYLMMINDDSKLCVVWFFYDSNGNTKFFTKQCILCVYYFVNFTVILLGLDGVENIFV